MLGVVSGDALRDRDSRWVKDSLRVHLDELAARVLKRYPRPDGIDPDWRIEQSYVFTLRD
ncbi:MAG TPA: hypothetical protein VJN44_09290 [Roseateles sp.]|nr:hypothetical protein [Roseateles sp.]